MDTTNVNFSASSIKSFNHCGLKYKYEKILKIKPPKETTHFRWLGRAVHATIYSALAKLQGEMKSWVIPENGKISKELALQNFDSFWDEDYPSVYLKNVAEAEIGQKPLYFKNKPSDKNLKTENQDDLQAAWRVEARKMAANGVDVISKIPKILEFERSINFKFHDRNFVGYIDVLAEDENGKIVYYDFKTSWSKPYGNTLQKDPQFILYSLALKDILGLDYYPKGYYVHLKSGSLVEFSMDESVLVYIDKYVQHTIDMIENDVFFDDFGGKLCGYCDFYDLCYKGGFNNEDSSG